MADRDITKVRDDASIVEFIDLALQQVGDAYQRGAENRFATGDPTTWDSSELVEWSANRAGSMVNDGSWHQYRQLERHGGALTPEEALQRPGALLFSFSSDPLASRDRPASATVAISLGDGRVIEVSPGSGVQVVDASTRSFNYGGTMPGFADSDGSPEVRAQVAELLGKHGLDVPPPAEPEVVAPDAGDPAQLRDRAVTLREQAAALMDEREGEADDARVARELLAEARRDHQQALDRRAAIADEERMAVEEATVNRPDAYRINDRVAELMHRLGQRPPRDDLMAPEGERPVPPPVETDPVKRAELEQELQAARNQLGDIVGGAAPAEARLAEVRARLAVADAEVADRADDVTTRERSASLDADATADPADLLREARALEEQARRLDPDGTDDRAPDQPGAPRDAERPTDAAAFADDLRVRAGRLDTEAIAAAKGADAHRDQALERADLADVRDEHAADHRQRASTAADRALRYEADAADSAARAREFAAEADARAKLADELQASGDDVGARAANERAIALHMRSSSADSRARELEQRSADARQDVTEEEQRATVLTTESDLLDEDAARLQTEATQLDQQADRLGVRADRQDRIAEEIDDAIESGVRRTMVIHDQVEGYEVTLEIDGRAPTEADLPYPSTAPSTGGATSMSTPTGIDDLDLEPAPSPETAMVMAAVDEADAIGGLTDSVFDSSADPLLADSSATGGDDFET